MKSKIEAKKSKIVNKRSGDTKISGGIKDSTVVVADGPSITNIHKNEFQKYEIPPMDDDKPFLKAAMIFGRKFMNLPAGWKLLTIVLPTILSIYDFFDFLYIKLISTPYSSIAFALSIFWLAFLIIFLSLFFNRRCKKCGKIFALNEDKDKNPQVLSKGFDPRDDKMKYKIRYFLKCDFCGNQTYKDEFVPTDIKADKEKE